MEALLYRKLEDRAVECRLCSHRCRIKAGRHGICGVRENRRGVLHTQVFGKLIARHIDPIEKKPFYHFQPGSLSYSIATVGCNFRCRFCQNADIAQMPTDHGGLIMGNPAEPEQVVAAALKGNCKSIAYTYTEPTVFFEFAYRTARIAHTHHLKNVFVTNGYMTVEALDMISPYLDAANVDLKAFTNAYYKKQCGAKLAPVLETLRQMKARNVFLEVTTLIVPGLNDEPDELKRLAGFIATEIDPATPWHISRFHPTYKLTDRPPTPVESLKTAYEIGRRAGLKYVYTGNVPGEESENTFCPGCGQKIIDRWGFQVGRYNIVDGRCKFCRTPIHGVGM